jgi:hypothetical protein
MRGTSHLIEVGEDDGGQLLGAVQRPELHQPGDLSPQRRGRADAGMDCHRGRGALCAHMGAVGQDQVSKREAKVRASPRDACSRPLQAWADGEAHVVDGRRAAAQGRPALCPPVWRRQDRLRPAHAAAQVPVGDDLDPDLRFLAARLEEWGMSSTGGTSRRRVGRWILVCVVLAIALVLPGFIVWASSPLGPMPVALGALRSDGQVQVETEPWLVFRPVGQLPAVGLVLYPGGRVDTRSYAPASLLARLGGGTP